MTTTNATRYNITDAHRVTGKSRTTLQRHLKTGRLSATVDEQGNKLIDASELIRVYGDDCDFGRASGAAAPSQLGGPPGEGAQAAELAAAQDRLAEVGEERRRERDQLTAQIEHLRDALERAQEGHNKAMLLLEHRRGGDLAAEVDDLRRRLAEQQDLLERRSASVRTATDQRPHRRSRDLPWWRWLAARPE